VTGIGLGGWTTAAFTPEEVAAAHQKIIAVGFTPGPATDGLIGFDIDGATAIEYCRARGCDPLGAQTWQVRRDTSSDRLKVVWRIPEGLRDHLACTISKVITKPQSAPGAKDGENVATYYGAGQIIVLGQHKSSGGNYYWPDGHGPADVAEIPPEWWALALGIADADPQQPKASNGNISTAKGDWRRVNPCPICGRDEHLICSKHTDGGSILCFHGGTFQPPTLKPGEVIPGTDGQRWAFTKTRRHGDIGEFSYFKIDEPKPLAKTKPAPQSRPSAAPRPADQPGDEDMGHGPPAGLQEQELFMGEHLGEMQEQEQEPPTYGELISATLQAIREANEDAEMDARAKLKHRFRVSDEQIGTALFKSHSAEKVQKVAAIHDSVDMAQVEQLDYLMDGWILKGDVILTYGTYGTGKTTLALAKLHAHVTGANLLDRDTPCTPGRGLFIATDSGTGPLKKAMLDLRLDPDNSPLMAPGHPEQRIWVWGHEPGQGQASWICDIHGVIRLEQFIQKHGITYVVIDSAKSVSSCAGWSYTSNESVAVLLKYLREGVAQPHGCCIEFLSHDGTAVGSHSGAKKWAEEPSMVCALTPAINPETNKFEGVIAEFKKDRAAHVDARRTLRFGLNDGRLELHPDIEVVSSCADALLTILWEAHQRGCNSVSGRELKAEAVVRFNRSHKTVENTLGKITGTGKGAKPSPVIRPKHGAYALAPAEIQKRMAAELQIPNRDLSLTGGVYGKPTAAQGVYVSPIQTPIGGIGGIDKPPFPPSGESIGGTQTQGHNSGLPEPPPDGGSTPPHLPTIGSTVSKWSKAERRHIPGWIVLEIEGDQATVRRASGGGWLTVPLSALRMERQVS
jgi:hypothetical protein